MKVGKIRKRRNFLFNLSAIVKGKLVRIKEGKKGFKLILLAI